MSENLREHPVQIRNLDRAIFQRLRIMAIRRNKSVGELLNEIIERWLDFHEPDDSPIYEHPPIGMDAARAFGVLDREKEESK